MMVRFDPTRVEDAATGAQAQSRPSGPPPGGKSPGAHGPRGAGGARGGTGAAEKPAAASASAAATSSTSATSASTSGNLEQESDATLRLQAAQGSQPALRELERRAAHDKAQAPQSAVDAVDAARFAGAAVGGPAASQAR